MLRGLSIRYAAGAIALSCLARLASLSAAEDPAKLATLQGRLNRLEVSVQRVEAIRAVKRLQHAYGHYSEMGLWHDFADLFADKGVGHYPAGILGKEAIRQLFLEDVGNGRLGLADGRLYPHIMLQPVVTIGADGTTAKGRWRVLAMLGGYGGTASWAGGVYENEYVLEKDVWTISDLHYYGQYSGRYEAAGWTAAKETIPFHYDPDRAGRPIVDVSTKPTLRAAVPPTPSLNSLQTQLAHVARRVQRLTDESDVQNLQHAYGYYVDRKMWDEVADLFADNGTMELGLLGVYVGKASIRRALNQFGPPGPRGGQLNDHLQLQTIVHVAADGRTARARGVELMMITTPEGRARWGEGIYENSYVKRNGVWRIESMRVYLRMLVDNDKGWAKDAQPAPGPSTQYRPDRPPTEVYDVYPKFHSVPFHFPNPVTGRQTQYPEGVATTADRRWGPASAGPSDDPKSSGITSDSLRTISDLGGSLTRSERAIAAAGAYDAVENLASAFGYYVEKGMSDEAVGLFARTAAAEGRRELLDAPYGRIQPEGSFTVHQMAQPVIHVAADGKHAKLRVRLLQLGGTSGGKGSWTGAVYENEAVNEGSIWKLQKIARQDIWTAGYRSDWVANAVAPPFHYANPVTGRKPPVVKH